MAKIIYQKIVSKFLLNGAACATLVFASGAVMIDTAAASSGNGAWQVNKVGAGSPQAYCTISQNFSGAGVVTLGQTPQGEYSLAIDSANKLFKAGQAQTITLKTSKVSAQNFNVTPQSEKLVVLNLGANSKLWMSFHAGDSLTLSVAGKDYNFEPTQTGRAQKDMMDCVTSLKTPAPKVAQASTQPAKAATDSSAPVTPAPAVSTVSAPSAVPSTSLAATSMASTSVTNQELQVREENARLRQALQDSNQKLVAAQSSNSTAKVTDLSEKLRLLELENAQLKATGSAARTGMSPDVAAAKAEVETLAKQKADLEKQLQGLTATKTRTDDAQLAQLVKENAELKAKLDQTLKTSGSNGASSAGLQSVMQERDGLKAQLAAVQKQLDDTKKQTASVTSNDMKLSDLQKENADLKARLNTANQSLSSKSQSNGDVSKIAQERDGLKAQLAQANLQLADVQKKSIEAARINNSTVELQAKVSKLESENATLRTQVSSSKSPTVTVNPNSQAELDKLKSQVADLQAQNSALANQVSSRQDFGSNTPAAQNFDLQQATKRYEEAQREIRRLGAIIQAQESKYKTDKKDMENMLFDPAIANPAQVAMKQSYEQRISDLENQLRSRGIAPAPSPTANFVPPIQATPTVSSPAKMASGYGALRSNEPPPAPSEIPPISEAEVTRDMMPLPVPNTVLMQQPAVQPAVSAAPQVAPVERIIERVVERTDPKKDDELKRISQELQALRTSQEKQALENAKLRTELAQKDKVQVAAAREIVKDAMVKPVQQQVVEPVAPVSTASVTPPTVATKQAAPLPRVEAPPIPAPVATQNFLSSQDLTNILKRGGVSLSQTVQDIGGGSEGYRAYAWMVGSVHGNAEQNTVASLGDYQNAIASYLDRARSRCKGDFAAEQSAVSGSAPNAQGYEIACIGSKVDSSASILFTYGDRVMTTIAHEGKSDSMAEAMSLRDKVAASWSNSVAAR